jgi:hypothetical protein
VNSWIVGNWTDSHSVKRGFIRSPSGDLTNVLLGTSTEITGISRSGETCGTFIDQNGTHGFVRKANGRVKEIDAPSGTGAFHCVGINNADVIAGSSFGGHYGFLRNPDGTVTPFTINNGVSVWVDGINTAGTVVGHFYDTQFSKERGFTRDIQGNLTVFDPSNQTNPHMVKFVIDGKGAIAGSYDTNSYDYRYAFLRTPNGNTIRLRPPEGDRNIQVNGINSKGDIISLYSTMPDVTHGSLRLP